MISWNISGGLNIEALQNDSNACALFRGYLDVINDATGCRRVLRYDELANYFRGMDITALQEKVVQDRSADTRFLAELAGAINNEIDRREKGR